MKKLKTVKMKKSIQIWQKIIKKQRKVQTIIVFNQFR